MRAEGDWATELAEAVASALAERERPVHLVSIKVVSPELVQVIFSDGDRSPLKGVAVDLASVQSGSERVRTSSVEELAFDVVTLAMAEPRALEEFSAPDNDGVRWLPLHSWLE